MVFEKSISLATETNILFPAAKLWLKKAPGPHIPVISSTDSQYASEVHTQADTPVTPRHAKSRLLFSWPRLPWSLPIR